MLFGYWLELNEVRFSSYNSTVCNVMLLPPPDLHALENMSKIMIFLFYYVYVNNVIKMFNNYAKLIYYGILLFLKTIITISKFEIYILHRTFGFRNKLKSKEQKHVIRKQSIELFT